jgi:hypothetical protein
MEQLPDEENMGAIDFYADEYLVSDRLKNLFEQYLPKLEYKQVVKNNIVFWKLHLPTCESCTVNFENEAITNISFSDNKLHLAFTVNFPGKNYLIINLAVAESILRRGILGLKLTRIGRDSENIQKEYQMQTGNAASDIEIPGQESKQDIIPIVLHDEVLGGFALFENKLRNFSTFYKRHQFSGSLVRLSFDNETEEANKKSLLILRELCANAEHWKKIMLEFLIDRYKNDEYYTSNGKKFSMNLFSLIAIDIEEKKFREMYGEDFHFIFNDDNSPGDHFVSGTLSKGPTDVDGDIDSNHDFETWKCDENERWVTPEEYREKYSGR